MIAVTIILIHQILMWINMKFYPLSDEESDERQENMENVQSSIITPATTDQPHQKFSRGDDDTLQEEFSMVKEKKIVCSLEILLVAFQA